MMIKMCKFIRGIFLVLVFVGQGLAGEVVVYNLGGTIKGTYTAIQAGIDACPSGGTVSVAPGTYTGVENKNLSWDPTVKHIAVIGDGVVIDCEGDGRAFYLSGGHTPQDLISGFTITNGSVTGNGGGIYIENGSPTISYCTIQLCLWRLAFRAWWWNLLWHFFTYY